MYEIGELVVYSTAGVCKITDIKTEDFYGEKKTYYILETVYGNKSVVHVPADNKVLMSKLRKMHTKEELTDIMDRVEKEETEWLSDYKERNEKYGEILKNGDSFEIVKILKAAYINEREIQRLNKKISMTDKKITDTAEKLVCEEFSTIFDMDFEEIKTKLKEKFNI